MQHHFPAASLQTWATLEKQWLKFTSIWSSNEEWPPHFRTFCELVEGEENKLTTFSTWTIMLGWNESNIISSSISVHAFQPLIYTYQDTKLFRHIGMIERSH